MAAHVLRDPLRLPRELEIMPANATTDLVRHSKIGTELSEEQAGVLARLVEVSDYADGDIVVEQGASDDKLRVVLAGALAVAKRDDDEWIRLNVLTAGDLAGELAFLDSRPRYAALVALGPTKVFSLQRAKLESLLDSHPLIVYRVMRGITRFAHQVLHRTGAQMTELTAYIYKSKAKY
jgi:CRP-like cAMP-binding protein